MTSTKLARAPRQPRLAPKSNRDRQIKVWLRDENDIRLRRLANALDLPVSRMVNLWIIEKLNELELFQEQMQLEGRIEKPVKHIPLLIAYAGAQRGNDDEA